MRDLITTIPNYIYDFVCRIIPGLILLHIFCGKMVVVHKSALANAAVIAGAWVAGLVFDTITERGFGFLYEIFRDLKPLGKVMWRDLTRDSKARWKQAETQEGMHHALRRDPLCKASRIVKKSFLKRILKLFRTGVVLGENSHKVFLCKPNWRDAMFRGMVDRALFRNLFFLCILVLVLRLLDCNIETQSNGHFMKAPCWVFHVSIWAFLSGALLFFLAWLLLGQGINKEMARIDDFIETNGRISAEESSNKAADAAEK